MANTYVTFAELQDALNGLDEDYISSLLSGVCANASERQTWCETAISRAESKVNGYISSQREVPVPSDSTYYRMIERWVINLVWYEVEREGMGDDVRTKVKEAHENTISDLKDVARGRLRINDDDGEGPSTQEGTSFYAGSDDADMDVDNLGEYF